MLPLCDGVGDTGCWKVDCARKAARKFDRKGRFVVMARVGVDVVTIKEENVRRSGR